MPVNVNELLDEAKCMGCASNASAADMLRLALLMRISEMTSPSGTSGIYSGAGSPVGVVTPTAAEAVYFDTSDGTQWNWYSGAWH